MRNGLSRFSVDCIYEDADDQLWFGTAFGVFRLESRESLFSTILLPGGVGGGTKFNVQSLLELETGNVLIGSYNSFFKYDTSTRQFQEYKIFERDVEGSSWHKPFIKAFVQDTGQNVWLATEGTGVLYFNNQSHTFFQPTGDKTKTDEQISLFNLSLLKDADGQLWLGGDHDLYTFDPKTNQAQAYTWGKTGQIFSSLKITAIH